MVWAVAILVVALLFWAIVEWAAVIGFFGALMGERVERCPQCGRYGLTSKGAMHPAGCPKGFFTHRERSLTSVLHHRHRLHMPR